MRDLNSRAVGMSGGSFYPCQAVTRDASLPSLTSLVFFVQGGVYSSPRTCAVSEVGRTPMVTCASFVTNAKKNDTVVGET